MGWFLFLTLVRRIPLVEARQTVHHSTGMQLGSPFSDGPDLARIRRQLLQRAGYAAPGLVYALRQSDDGADGS